ncbi:MAG: hypothetical protein HC773_08885 [Scytonema sp. CRU_2_7]|nr:hypothetical protein [Scytonema sp. CRU_2_7]
MAQVISRQFYDILFGFFICDCRLLHFDAKALNSDVREDFASLNCVGTGLRQFAIKMIVNWSIKVNRASFGAKNPSVIHNIYLMSFPRVLSGSSGLTTPPPSSASIHSWLEGWRMIMRSPALNVVGIHDLSPWYQLFREMG